MNTHVTFETAKLLKEKEFDIPTIYYFDSFGDKGSATNGTNWNQSEELLTSAPTIAQVVMWLYEKHGIWISVYQYKDHAADVNDDYVFRTSHTKLREFNSPEEAYEAAIFKILNK